MVGNFGPLDLYLVMSPVDMLLYMAEWTLQV